jgi:hypothetical protein
MTEVTLTAAMQDKGSSTLDLLLWKVGIVVAVLAAAGLVIATKGKLGLSK